MAGLKRKRATHDEIIVVDDSADHADHYLTVSLSGCEWVRGPMLGQGGFGSVYLGFVKKPRLCLKGVPRIVAVKSTLASQAHDLMVEDILLYIFRRCPFVINCYGEDETIGADGRHLFNVFLEYADGGTMADLIEKSRGFGLREFQPENILLVSDTAGSSGGARFVPKIGDLGLTKKANQKWEKPSFGGTPMYLSPEAVVYGIQQQPSDIWALGCVVLQMLTGRHPWDFTPGAVFDVRDLLTALLASRIPAIPG
ncbi:protein kinase byr2-like [Prunus yedoensis var. nudiflora]|uniref:Protein kinase byr2-like n=1 Tax=Prunus yedoensis var. nudiflora TaxID=2094558 RepID=A0A314YPJ1_PRUYE|nr:protein kinase byr2-like [Prunus yedoensis var. nudiflora]